MIVHGIHVHNEALPYKGKITAVHDGEFIVQLAARMGVLKLPSKSLICEKKPQVGDEVKLLMSYVQMAEDEYEQEEGDLL